MKAAVLGAGSWGTTFAQVLCDAGTPATLWARQADVAAADIDERVGALVEAAGLYAKRTGRTLSGLIAESLTEKMNAGRNGATRR